MKNMNIGIAQVKMEEVNLPPFEQMQYTPPPRCKSVIQIEEEHVTGIFETAFGNFGRALDSIVPALKRAAESLSYKEEDLQDYQMRRWLSQVPHGGIVGDKAVLIVYNEERPSASYIVVEELES